MIIKKPFRKIIAFIQRDTKKGVKEIKKTNWTHSIFIIVLGLIVGFVITVSFQFVIQSNSNGSLKGNKLKEYLISELSSKLNIKNKMLQVDNFTTFKVDDMFNDDTIVICGNYSDNNLNGRYVALFERREKTIFNYIFGTNPSYQMKGLLNYKSKFADKYFFYNPKINIRDIDMDGQNEIVLSYITNFANRQAQSIVLLNHCDSTWSVVVPDLIKIQEEIKKIDHNIENIYMDTYKFEFNNKPENIYLLSSNGFYYFDENPNSNKPILNVNITLLKKGESNIGKHDFVSIMYSIKDGEIIRNNVWNKGNPKIWSMEHPINISDGWGTSLDEVYFYRLD